MTSPVRAPRPTPRRLAPEPAPRRDHLRVVPTPSRSRRSTTPSARRRRTGAVLGAAMVIVFGSLMASAIFHGLLVSGQSNLDRLDTQLEERQGELAREKLDLADLQSPARIATEARKIGMVPADTQTWISPVAGTDPIVTGQAEADPGPTDQTGSELATGNGTADGEGDAQ